MSWRDLVSFHITGPMRQVLCYLTSLQDGRCIEGTKMLSVQASATIVT
jgi:hypothetical protein